MLIFRLFWEFFKTGLFAIGGGLATLPFLYDMQAATGWFTLDDISNMIAISESTPGPMGINMATYTGFTSMGVLGGYCCGGRTGNTVYYYHYYCVEYSGEI